MVYATEGSDLMTSAALTIELPFALTGERLDSRAGSPASSPGRLKRLTPRTDWPRLRLIGGDWKCGSGQAATGWSLSRALVSSQPHARLARNRRPADNLGGAS